MQDNKNKKVIKVRRADDLLATKETDRKQLQNSVEKKEEQEVDKNTSKNKKTKKQKSKKRRIINNTSYRTKTEE